MTRRPSYTKTSLPVSMMVWTIPDAVIEDHALLASQFADIRNAGFDGVAVYVRCSRYTWDDPAARDTLVRISALCRKSGLHLWIGPDPRFISRALIAHGGGAELLLFGDSSRAARVPNTAPIVDGRFSVRCLLHPRHGHMLNEVAIEYTPIGIPRCYAVRDSSGPLRRRDVIDITDGSHFFYNARERYVEAFGRFAPPDESNWRAVAFFHVVSSHVDYSSLHQMREYARRLEKLKHAGILAESLMWDEAGYTCTYSSLPYTRTIRSAFRRAMGFPLERSLWKMAFDATDGSHIPVRVHYYRIVQRTVNDAQRFANRVMRKTWGPGTIASVHDTWHFESADMCDMNHGSLDLWRGCRVKSGGFVDLGGVNALEDAENPYYANLAAISVIAASLGRHSNRRFAFNNLWTVGDDEGTGWQRKVMDHCVNVMALFGTRWLAHAYGPVGTIGEENTFLGSPPLPGYPHHSTWPGFPEWNERLRRHVAASGGRLPWVNVLLVFPVETMYAQADRRANEYAAQLFRLILSLIDAQFQVDVVSTEVAATGRWNTRQFVIGHIPYEAVILPFVQIIDRSLLRLMRKKSDRVVLFGGAPEWTVNGEKGNYPGERITENAGVIQRLEQLEVTRPFRTPMGTWTTVTHTPQGTLVSIVPARSGFVYEGAVTNGTTSLVLPTSTGLTRILFPSGGEPPIFKQ